MGTHGRLRNKTDFHSSGQSVYPNDNDQKDDYIRIGKDVGPRGPNLFLISFLARAFFNAL